MKYNKQPECPSCREQFQFKFRLNDSMIAFRLSEQPSQTDSQCQSFSNSIDTENDRKKAHMSRMRALRNSYDYFVYEHLSVKSEQKVD